VPINGDAAVYAHQLETGAWTARWTHAVYIALLAGPVAALPLQTPVVMDLLSVVAAMVAVGGLVAWGGVRGTGTVLAVALVLPVAGFGEVDPVWMAFLVGALAPDRRVAAGCLAIAVGVSPTALAAVPWIAATFRDGRSGGAAASLAVLSFVSAGAWWTGTRGVWSSWGTWSPDPLEHVVWVVVPWVLAMPALRRVDALALFGLLAPGDVPGFFIAALPALRAVGDSGLARDRRSWPFVVLLLVAGGRSGWHTHDRALREARTLERLSLSPGDQVVGPWSWGVRASLGHTGRPDGIDFGPKPGPCAGERVFLPPDRLGAVRREPCATRPGDR
jgi:hypothetical protein